MEVMVYRLLVTSFHLYRPLPSGFANWYAAVAFDFFFLQRLIFAAVALCC
jgi:hypothetical protein